MEWEEHVNMEMFENVAWTSAYIAEMYYNMEDIENSNHYMLKNLRYHYLSWIAFPNLKSFSSQIEWSRQACNLSTEFFKKDDYKLVCHLLVCARKVWQDLETIKPKTATEDKEWITVGAQLHITELKMYLILLKSSRNLKKEEIAQMPIEDNDFEYVVVILLSFQLSYCLFFGADHS